MTFTVDWALRANYLSIYSRTDHICTLYAIAQHYLCRKGHKLYVAFVDFIKAFDSVHHGQLLETLQEEGFRSRFYYAMKATYDSLLSCVRMKVIILSPKGVRQDVS